MQSTVISYSPKSMQFSLSLLVMLLLYALAGAAFYQVVSNSEDITLYTYFGGIWPVVFLFPVLSAVIYMYSSRKHQLCVSGVKDPLVVAEWTVRSLKKEGLRVRAINENEYVLESKKKYNRTMGHWFGTELVKVTYNSSQVKTVGNYRYTDALNSKMRFGKMGVR